MKTSITADNIDPRRLLKWLFLGCCMHYWFFMWLKTTELVMMNFHDHVMSEYLPLGKFLHSFFASLLSFALSSKMLSKICYREDFDRCKIHPHQEMFVIMWSLLNHVNETNSAQNSLRNKPVQQISGINSTNSMAYWWFFNKVLL